MNSLPASQTVDPLAAFPTSLASQVFGNKVGAVDGAAIAGAGMQHSRSGQLAPPPGVIYGAVRDASGQLRQHINSCRRSAGPLHHVHCFVELMYEIVATRLVTTTVLLLAGMLAINALV